MAGLGKTCSADSLEFLFESFSERSASLFDDATGMTNGVTYYRALMRRSKLLLMDASHGSLTTHE
jgi:hypothetical protein